MSQNSEIDDALDFIEESGSFEKKTNTSQPRSSFAREDQDDSSSSKERGQVTQYEVFGSGFVPTPSTVKILPPGCYDIKVSDLKGVYASPSFPSSGLLLDLPEMRSDYVIKLVDTFWNSESDYKNGNQFVIGGAAFKSGVMIYGPPGCHAKGTKVLMYNGDTIPVEDIRVGDLLMGPDSKPREVLKLISGKEEMVRINPTKGESFVINKSHIMHLVPSGSDVLTRTAVNMKFSDWLLQGNNFKERYKLTKSSVNFEEKQLPLDPYFLGIWLGDGTSTAVHITTMDTEVVEFLENFSIQHNILFKIYATKGKAKTYALTNGIGQKNPLLTTLQQLELIKNKHVPKIYKIGSREQRFEILAGLLDSDGHLSNKGFDFVSKYEVLADDIVYLSRSLGLAAYKVECQKSCQNDFTGTYYRVSISGDTNLIPTKVIRKQSEPREQIKNVLRTGFTYEILPEDNFYGFTLDSDHLYLTNDFMIHHNSGKSSTLKLVMNKLVNDGGIVFYANSMEPYFVNSFLESFNRIESNRKSIVVLEDFDSLIDRFGETQYLEMLDSAKTINNVLFIATTNYPDRLDPRIYNRPGRFSHVVKIGLPPPAARKAYLEAILKDHRDVEYIVKHSEGFTIDHLTALVNETYRQHKNLEEEIARLRTLFKMPEIESTTKMGF